MKFKVVSLVGTFLSRFVAWFLLSQISKKYVVGNIS